MSRHWKACVAAILITGSTSSTSGATELCAAPPPASAEAALNTRPASTALPISYREYITHPAMTLGLTTDGTFDLGRGDTLIRHQTRPTDEITEIGTRFIKLTRVADKYENTVPIPDRLKPFLTVMRGIVSGDGAALSGYETELKTETDGWTLHLTSADQTPIELFGCGPALSGIKLMLDGSEERIITFLPPP